MVTQQQKKQLKAMAHDLKPVVIIGKDGLTDNVIESTLISLVAHQLIKVRLLNTAPAPVLEIAYDLSSKTKAEIIMTVGRMIVLYRPSKERKKWII